MKIINFSFLLMLINSLSLTDFEKTITSLKNLEKYIKQYIKEKGSSQNLSHLIAC